MSRSVVVDSDLTVTVHDDGHVTWSSSFPMTPPRVARTIMSAAMHAVQRLRVLIELGNDLAGWQEAAERAAGGKP